MPETETLIKPEHTLDWKGYFGEPWKLAAGLNPELVQTAGNYGAQISRTAEGLFQLKFIEGDGSLDFYGGLAEIKDYLKMLKQPLYTSLRQITNDKKEAHQERLLAHRIFRYALTGSTSMPEFLHPSLADEINSCHAVTEQAIRTNDMWAATGEIDAKGRVDSYNAEEQKEPLETAILPSSRFHPSKGYEFHMHDIMRMPKQTPMAEWFWDTLNKVTNNRYIDRDSTVIHLLPEEMFAFSAEIHDGIKKNGLKPFVDAIAFQEDFDTIVRRIDDNTQKIAQSELFSRAINSDDTQQDPAKKLKNLARQSTALTSIIDSENLRKRWSHYFFMQRNDAPMEKINRELALFSAVVDHYSSKQDLSSNDIQSVANVEAISTDPAFYGLLAFGAETGRLLGNTLNAEDDQELKRRLSEMQKTFETASITGNHLAEDHMNYDHQRVLDLIMRTTGQGDSALKRASKEFVENSWDFTADIIKFPFRGTKEALIFSTFVGLTYYMSMGGNSAVATAVATTDHSMQTAATTTSALPGLEGLGNTTTNLAPTGEALNYHMHYTLLGSYKHFFNTTVVDTTKTFVNMEQMLIQKGLSTAGFPVNSNSSFFQASNKTADVMGSILYYLNRLQNYPAHTGMFAAFAAKGYMHGLRGITRMFDFFHPFINAGVTLAKERPLAFAGAAAGFAYDRYVPIKPLIYEANTGIAFTMIAAAIGYKLWRRKAVKPNEFTHSLTKNAEILMNAADEQTATMTEIPESKIEELLEDAAAAQEKIESELPEIERAARLRLKYRNAEENETAWPRLKRIANNVASATGLKSTGLSEEFNIDANNLRPVMQALAQMDLALAFFAEQAGAKNELYQSDVKKSLDDVVESIVDYQKNIIDEPQLQRALEKNLRDVIGAQMLMYGQSPIYEKLYGTTPDEKSAAFLTRYGKNRYGHAERMEKINKSLDKIDATEGEKLALQLEKPSLQTWQNSLAIDFSNAVQSGKIALINLGDSIASATRAAQNIYTRIPYKKPAAIALGTFAMGSTALSIGGYGGPGHEMINTVSSLNGVFTTAATSVTVFVPVNIVDDQVFVHLLLGGASVLAGTAAHYADRGFVRPIFNCVGKEKVPALFNFMTAKAKDLVTPPDISAPSEKKPEPRTNFEALEYRK